MDGSSVADDACALLARLDAGNSPLPPQAAWPQSLRTATDIVLHSPMAMLLLWGPQLCQLYNDAFAALIGLRHPYAFGRPVHETWPEHRGFAEPVYQAVLAGESRSFVEQPFAMAPGNPVQTLWVDITYSPVRDEQGQVQGVLLTVIDTQQRRQTQAELQRRSEASILAQRDSEERLQLALEASSAIGTWDWDIEQDHFRADGHFAQMHGVDPQQAGLVPIGVYLDGVHPEDRAKVTQGIGHCLRHSGEYTEEYRLLMASGEQRWVFVRGRCYRNGQGWPQRFIGASIDITERKEAEAALRESEHHFRMAIELSPAMHWTADARGRANQRPERWKRLTGHHTMGKHWLGLWHDLVHVEDRQATVDAWQYSVANGTQYDAEYRLRTADGSYRWMHARALPRRDEHGQVQQWYGMTEDVDNRRRVEQALRDLNETLEVRVAERTRALAEVNRRLQNEMQERERAEEALRHAQKMEALGQLTGGIAHDFNNMLTGIIGSLDLMQRYIGAGRSAEIGRFADAAVTSANRAAALTHRLLAFSRRQSLDRRRLEPNQLVSSLEELLSRTTGEQIELSLSLAAEVWPVNTDASQLESALLNLVINARDAMPAGGLLSIETANCTLASSPAGSTLEQFHPGDYVMFSVSDNGAGMTAPVLAKAFDPFFTTKPIGQGTGLGLSMIYGFAQQSGGQVTLHSRAGAGTCVRLYLPRFTAQASEPGDLPVPGEAPLAVAGESVLLVEDDPQVRMLVLNVLDELGYVAHPAADANSALALIESPLRIDLLVTDVGLPGLNGRQLAEIARQHRPQLKVLFMTGYAQMAAERSGFLAEGMDMVAKPFSIDLLANKIRDMINQETLQ